MNGRTRKKLYVILSNRSGDHCAFCRTPSSERQLVIDHIDNNNSNNNLYNLQLLCRRCNYVKNSRGPVDTCERPKETEIQINRKKEPAFRKYVYEQLNVKSHIWPKVIISSGAEKIGISTTTAKRYLDKLCSKEGLCKISNGLVCYDREHPLFKKEIESYDGMFLGDSDSNESKSS